MSIIINEEKNEVKRYLLGQLDEADQERLELRLLTDAAFSEEFDTVVDEIADQYVGNELDREERKRVEQYFLASSERQQKVQFASELLKHAEAERGERRVVVPSSLGIFERLRLLWTAQPFSYRTAATVFTIVIVAGLTFLSWPRGPASGNYASVTLHIGASDRAGGAETKSVRLEPGHAGIRIELTLPEQSTQAKNYRVELLDEQQRPRNLPVAERTANSVIVMIPANEISRGSYIIHLHAVNADATEQRIRGSYSFNVE